MHQVHVLMVVHVKQIQMASLASVPVPLAGHNVKLLVSLKLYINSSRTIISESGERERTRPINIHMVYCRSTG